MPGAMAPTSPSRPKARAPPAVAAWIATAASTPVGLGSAAAASRQSSFIAVNMLWQSPQLQLSQPKATFTPASITRRIGATPLLSFRLLAGLCARLARAWPSSAISSPSSQTPCAIVRRSLSNPTSRSQRSMDPPCAA